MRLKSNISIKLHLILYNHKFKRIKDKYMFVPLFRKIYQIISKLVPNKFSNNFVYTTMLYLDFDLFLCTV